MKFKSKPPFLKSRRRGVALVIALGFLVLLTGLVTSYLVSMRADRQSTTSYSQRVRAQELAIGGLEEIKGDLMQEIISGSLLDNDPPGATYTQNGVRIYVPATNKASQPARFGFDADDYAGDISNTKLPPTLLRVSRSGANLNTIFPTADYAAEMRNAANLPSLRASPASTQAGSLNNRNVDPERWNDPLLLGTSLATTHPLVENPPEWIYVTRAGSGLIEDDDGNPQVISDAHVDDLKTNNDLEETGQVLGRYAYVVYLQDGLLDINAAGYFTNPPATTNADDLAAAVRGKSAIAYADLASLPGFAGVAGIGDDIDELLLWRHKGTMTNQGGDFLVFVKEAQEAGFSSFNNGDSPFIGRQDLIEYFGQKSLPTEALAYLGTFSRAINAPSWGPTFNAPSVNYKDEAETSSSANRHIPNIRDASTGEPLVKKRFPLNRIAYLANTSNSAEALDYFGLSWDNGNHHWVYNHGNGDNIYTLEQVASQGREPDFFELLKAAILSGSVGTHPGETKSGAHALLVGAAGEGPAGIDFNNWKATVDSHIIQIGANIIDQFDEDSEPTAIYFADGVTSSGTMQEIYLTAYGVENLPYLHGARNIGWLEDIDADGAYSAGDFANLWLQPAIWNPHQKPGPNDTGYRPTQFRVRMYGTLGHQGAWGDNGSVFVDMDPMHELGPAATNPDSQYIEFTDSRASSIYQNAPLYLAEDGQSVSSVSINKGADLPMGTAFQHSEYQSFVGFYCGRKPINGTNGSSIRLIPNHGGLHATMVLEYFDTDGSSGVWRPYSTMSRLWKQNGNLGKYKTTVSNGQLTYIKADPRTDRFSSTSTGGDLLGDQGHWDVAADSERTAYFAPRVAAGFHFTGSNGGSQLFQGEYSVNLPDTRTYYQDPDGVTRPGDAFRGDSATGDGRPTFAADNEHSRRSIILNRPFKSVGELGYIFRDLPYKTLDFWSQESADAALLDVFCIEDEPELAVGHVNPNAAPAPVLSAILKGSSKREVDDDENLGDEAGVVADTIVQYYREEGPFPHRASLVASVDFLCDEVISGTDDSLKVDYRNKSHAESAVRALAPVTNFRTWNLLIDVIAQSGRFPGAAEDLDDFIVEGEKRYWLHVAIDRYTGEIVEEYIEPVYE